MRKKIQISNKSKAIVVTILLSVLSLPVSAKTYSDPNLGFRITIDDYFSQFSQQGELYYFVSADNTDMIIIQNWPGLRVDEVREASRTGYQAEGVALTSQGSPKEHPVTKGWGLTVPVNGFIEQTNVNGILGGYVGNEGQGFIILLASSPEKWPKLESRSAAVFDSIAFTRYSGGADAAKWKKYFQGKRLAYRSTYDGGSSREDYYLCSDGSFLRSAGSTDFASAPGVSVFGQSGNRGAGRWRIQAIDDQPNIIFDYHNGNSESYRLEDKKGRTLLNGSRYFVVENDQCN